MINNDPEIRHQSPQLRDFEKNDLDHSNYRKHFRKLVDLEVKADDLFNRITTKPPQPTGFLSRLRQLAQSIFLGPIKSLANKWALYRLNSLANAHFREILSVQANLTPSQTLAILNEGSRLRKKIELISKIRNLKGANLNSEQDLVTLYNQTIPRPQKSNINQPVILTYEEFNSITLEKRPQNYILVLDKSDINLNIPPPTTLPAENYQNELGPIYTALNAKTLEDAHFYRILLSIKHRIKISKKIHPQIAHLFGNIIENSLRLTPMQKQTLLFNFGYDSRQSFVLDESQLRTFDEISSFVEDVKEIISYAAVHHPNDDLLTELNDEIDNRLYKEPASFNRADLIDAEFAIKD